MDDETWLSIVRELECHMRAIMKIAKEYDLKRLDVKAISSTGWVSADVYMDCVHYIADINGDSTSISREHYAKSGLHAEILKYGGQ